MTMPADTSFSDSSTSLIATAAEEGTVTSDDNGSSSIHPIHSYSAISAPSATPATPTSSTSTSACASPSGTPPAVAAAVERRKAAEQQNEHEMNNPWPATFERSVTILSQPILDRGLVAFASESLHILPPTKMKKNTSLSNLNRGWRTPDPSPESKRVKRCSESELEEDDDDEEGGAGIFQRMGLTKTLTMDWRYNSPQHPSSDSHRVEAFQQLTKMPTKSKTKMKNDGAKDATRERMPDMDVEDKASKTTLRQCVFNTANTLMGMGIISLPFCLRTAGWLGGLVALTIFGAVTWWTSILIGRALNGDPRTRSLAFKNNTTRHGEQDDGNGEKLVRLRRQLTSFPDIAREAFGQNANIVLSSVLYFELFSALAVFFVSLGDHLHSLIPSISETHHMMMMSILLIVPTVICKTPRLLSYLSAVGTFTTVALVLSVFFAAVWEGDIASEMVVGGATSPQTTTIAAAGSTAQSFHSMFIPTGLPVSLGLVAYCFGGHAVVPSIYNSMARPQDYERMIGYSYMLVMTCCMLVAVSGYYMFGSTVSDQVTLSLERAPIDAESAMRVLTWLMVVTSLSKFTLYLFPLALGVEEIIAPYVPTDQVMELSFMIIKLTLIASSLFVGICIPSFAFLCSVIGLICTVIVSVIFPAAAHLKLFGPHLKDWEKRVDYLFIFGGSAVAIFGTVATVGSFNQ